MKSIIPILILIVFAILLHNGVVPKINHAWIFWMFFATWIIALIMGLFASFFDAIMCTMAQSEFPDTNLIYVVFMTGLSYFLFYNFVFVRIVNTNFLIVITGIFNLLFIWIITKSIIGWIMDFKQSLFWRV